MPALRASRQSSPVPRAKTFPEFRVNFNGRSAVQSLNQFFLDRSAQMTSMLILQKRMNEIANAPEAIVGRLRFEKSLQAVRQLNFKSVHVERPRAALRASIVARVFNPCQRFQI